MPDAHAVIEKLPHPERGWMLPGGYNYCGPLNPLEQQLDEDDNPLPGQEPINSLDGVCKEHDINYRDFPDEKHRWDKQMLRRIDSLGPSSGWKESIARKLVKGIISGKVRLGLGVSGGCLEDSDEDESKVIILHAPNKEMGRLLKENGVQKVK